MVVDPFGNHGRDEPTFVASPPPTLTAQSIAPSTTYSTVATDSTRPFVGGASQGPNPPSYVTIPSSINSQTTPMGGASTSNGRPLGTYDLASAVQPGDGQRGGREDEEFEVSGHFVSDCMDGPCVYTFPSCFGFVCNYIVCLFTIIMTLINFQTSTIDPKNIYSLLFF